MYASLGHNHDSQYAALSHNHDDRYYQKAEVDTLVAQSGTAPDLSNYYTQTETDALLLNKAAANHNHNHLYVTPAALTASIQDRVDYNSLGMILNGYEQTDSNLLRFASLDMNILAINRFSGGSTVETLVPTYDIYSAGITGITSQLAAMEARLASVETLAQQTAVSFALHSQHG